MLQPHPCLHEFKKRDQSLVFMMTIQHRESSVNILLHMDHSQVHNSIGSIAKAALPTENIMVGQHLRMMITTTGHLVDHLTHRTTSRSLIEVMATPEDIISQRVTVSLNQNGCSLDQAVKRNLWSLMKKIKMCVFNIAYVFTNLSLLHITRAKTTPFIALLEQNFNIKHTLHVLM